MKKTALIIFAALFISGPVFAGNKMYQVTITNVTASQIFTPVLAATHNSDIAIFELGSPASGPLEELAEGGATLPLEDVLMSMPDKVDDTVTTGGLLMPGESVTFMIEGRHVFGRLSFAAMLLPTHDTFVAINSLVLPRWSVTTMAMAYDAGTEINTEDCTEIPGPFCGGEGYSEDGGEGFVHVANGIHGIGDVPPETFDWRGAVARVTVRRVN